MINPVGYLKLWRELMEKPIWLNSTPEQCKILITLLTMANYNGKEWEWKGEKFKAEKGQFITSLESIVKNCGKGISVRHVRTAVSRFQKLGFLTNESTKTGRLVTIVNWHVYQQDEEKTTKQLTDDRQRPDKDLTTREEVKKDKKDKETIYTDLFEKFYLEYPNPFNKDQSFTNWKNTLKTDTVENIMLATKNYIKYLRDNNKTDKQYFVRSTNFIGQHKEYKGYLKYEPVEQKSQYKDQSNYKEEMMRGKNNECITK